MKILYLAIGIVATPVLAIAASERMVPRPAPVPPVVAALDEGAFAQGTSYRLLPTRGIVPATRRTVEPCGPDRRSAMAGFEPKDAPSRSGSGTRSAMLTDAGFTVSSLGGGATADQGTRGGC